MGKKPETATVQSIIKALNKYCSGFYFKVHGNAFQRKGVADILGVCKGTFVAVEVKHPDDPSPISPAQRRFIRDVQRQGGIAIICDNPDDAVTRVLNRIGD